MLGIGVQSQNIIMDDNPMQGFSLLKKTGFTNVDFSLNGYLKNTDIYKNQINNFFDQSKEALLEFFAPHKEAAEKTGITINQMHMSYPIYVPAGTEGLNQYLWNEVAKKSMLIAHFLECPYVVIHGYKLARYLGSEELEWRETRKLIDYLASMYDQYGITICVENLYDGIGGHLVEGPCCNVHRVIERIDEINRHYGAEVLGFCFDTGHANLVGLDFESFISTLGHRLKVLHIHDNDGVADLHQIPFTFTKTRENATSTDWNGFIKGLRNIGYDKVLSFETAPVLSTFPKQLKGSALSMIAQIGHYFSDEITKT